MKSLSKKNRKVSLRLTRIMQCELSWLVLSQILLDCTAKDRDFIMWLNNSCPIYCHTTMKDATILQRGEIAFAKRKFTRYPWFDEEGKLMIKVGTVGAIEKRIRKEKE